MARSDIDHYDGLAHWGPYDDELLDPLLERLVLPSAARALDVGCGSATLLLRLAQRFGVRATGVDRSAAALNRARTAFETHHPSEPGTWLCRDATDLTFDEASFDLIAWLGGPFVGDSHASTLRTLACWMRPRGWLLLGQGYWITAPPPAYLEATGLPADALTTEAEMLAPALGAGLEILQRRPSPRAAWDRFEGTILGNHEAYAAAHPDDADLQATGRAKRAWHEAQQRWGRDVMGFSLYLLRKP